MQTEYTKTSRGWEGETTLRYGAWLLKINTHKDSAECPDVVSDAYACCICPETGLVEHAIGIAGHGDFYCGISRSARGYKRVTKRSIQDFHENVALKYVEEVKRRAAEYYASPAMKWREGGAEFANALWAELGAEMQQAA